MVTLPNLSRLPLRHRSINLFLTGYRRLWIEAETYAFEEKLVQDLSVSNARWRAARDVCHTSSFYIQILNSQS